MNQETPHTANSVFLRPLTWSNGKNNKVGSMKTLLPRVLAYEWTNMNMNIRRTNRGYPVAKQLYALSVSNS